VDMVVSPMNAGMWVLVDRPGGHGPGL
jgi:hypothetical protein